MQDNLIYTNELVLVFLFKPKLIPQISALVLISMRVCFRRLTRRVLKKNINVSSIVVNPPEIHQEFDLYEYESHGCSSASRAVGRLKGLTSSKVLTKSMNPSS